MKNSIISFVFNDMPRQTMSRARGLTAALVLGGLALSQCAQAQIAYLNGPSPIEYRTNAAVTLNSASFTVSSGASVLVVMVGGRTQGDSPGSDPGLPATMTWNGNTLTRAIGQGSHASTYDDNAIYYLMNPPAGSGSMSASLNSTITECWWMAYTLTGVNTSVGVLTNSAFATGNGTGLNTNSTVTNVVAGDWAAVAGSASIGTHSTPTFSVSGSGSTVLTTIDNSDGQADQIMGSISNCPAGNDLFTFNSGQASGQTPKLAMVEALFATAAPVGAPNWVSVTTSNPAAVNLTWSAVPNAYYLLTRGVVNGGPYTDFTNVLSTTNYQDRQVVSGTQYYYVVTAANAAGANTSVQTNATPVGLPFAPVLGGGAAGAGNVGLSWTAPFGATNYLVLAGATSGGEVQIGTTTNNKYLVTGLALGSTNYFTVKAVSPGGTSPASVEISVVTLGAAWYLFDNFSLDTVGSPLNGQTGSAGLGLGWTNLGGGSPIVVANNSTFGGANYAQYASGSVANIGDYESGLGIASNSTAATVFLEFSLPGISGNFGVTNGGGAVAMNFDIDNSSPPGALTGGSATGPSAQFNYDNTTGYGFFRVNGAGTFYYVTISPNNTPYLAVPGSVYYFWFVMNAAKNTYQVYLANGSETGTNVDAGGLGATPTLMWGTTATNGLGSVITFGFRNVSAGGLGGQPVNYIGTGPGSTLGAVAQNEYANIYVDRSSQDLTNPVTGAAPNGTPQVLTQPQALELYAGATATFSVVGSAGVTYQWESNGVAMINSGQVSGVTSSSLVISNVATANVANYSCVVANPTTAAFASSIPAALTIVTPNGKYETANAAAGPAHFYAFDDTGSPATGTEVAYDYAGGDNGIYGTNALNGFTPISGPQPATGFPGFSAANYAAQFTASDEPSGVTINSPWNFNTNTVTIAAWINPNATAANATAIVFNRGSGSDVEGLNFSTSSDSALSYTWNNDAGTYNWDSGLVPPLNQWSFVALVVTPTNATISMMNTNGLFSSTHVYAHAAAAFAGTTLIGDDNFSTTGARTFPGAIDEVSVFGQALTQSQLYSIYTNASGVVMEPPTNTVTLVTAEPIYPAQSAQISSIDGGSAPLSYTWQINGINLVDGTDSFGTIYGSATPFLTISNLAVAEAGQILSVALVTANAYGAYTSSVPVQLSISTINPDQTINTTGIEPAGDDWNTGAYWSDGNAASVSVYSEPGSTYYVVPGTRERTPVSTNAVFPGNVMVVQGNGVLLDGNASTFTTQTTTGELVAKESGTTTVNSYGLVYTQGGTITFPDLQLNGGQIDNGTASAVTLAGEIEVLTNSAIYADGSSAFTIRSFQINALLTGAGTLTYSYLGSSAAYQSNAIVISNPANTFSGQWNILQGALVGNAANSLGTNSITIASNAALETTYNLYTTNGVLNLNGRMYLYTTDTFMELFVNNTNVAAGTYTWAQLNAAFPANFPATWQVQLGSVTGTNTGAGSITVLGGPPVFTQQPTPAAPSLYPSQTAQFAALAPNATSYQWWFTNLSNIATPVANGVGISGATSNVLTIANVQYGNAGAYVLIASNAFGLTLSSAAILTVLATNAPEAITMSGFEPGGDDWNTGSFWSDGNPATISALEYPGSTYEVLAGALLRTPITTISPTNFPGISLQIDGSGVFTNNPAAGSPQGELRLKEDVGSQTIYFPLLIMNGGQVDNGGGGNGTAILQGTIEILSNTPVYVDNGGGAGRVIEIDACLTGNGSIEYHDYDASMTGCLDITCSTNTFSGAWKLVQGPLLGAGTNSLGTNSITVGPKAALETLYNLDSPAATLTLNGIMYLHQNDTFYELAVNGTGVPAGVYSSAQLTNAFPTNFPAAWASIYGSGSSNASGSITVLHSLIIGPTINSQPPDLAEEFAGAEMNYSVSAGGNQVDYQWFMNGSAVAGATNSNYSFISAFGTNIYSCVLSNSAGVASTMFETNIATLPPTIVTFDDTANWTLQGNTPGLSLSGDILTLTDNSGNEEASAFYDLAQYVEGFNASFTYTAGGNLAADGVTFCVQNSTARMAALGGGGGSLGYAGINSSMAFEMNIYAAAGGGVGIGFGTNGVIANPYLSVSPVGLASGDPILVNLYYMKGFMRVTLQDTSNGNGYTNSFALADYGAVLGDSVGYIGFTGADGGSYSQQQISNFNFVPAAQPVLSVVPSGAGNLTLAWSGGVLTNMVLQQSSSLTGPWQTSAATPTLVGANYQVPVSSASGTQFFRLAAP